MISWFETAEFRDFGDRLAKTAIAALQQGKSGKQKRISQHELIRRLLPQVSDFSAKHRGNFYKRAKFGNAFKWKLLDAHVPAQFADDLTKELLIHFR